MRPRVDPFVFWFLCAFVSLGVGGWWITLNVDQSLRAQAFFGLLIATALAARAGMERPG